MAFRYPPADTPVGDQFRAYTRSAATFLVYGAVFALLLGIALGSLSVWQLHDQYDGFETGLDNWRGYIAQFLQNFGGYALVAAVLFAGGMIVNSLAWFYSAISSDFDDLYDDAADDELAEGVVPPNDPSEWTRPIGSD